MSNIPFFNKRPLIDYKATGLNIRKLREKYGYTRYDLAEMLCTSYAAVANWETESNRKIPAIDKLVMLAKIFECSMEEVLVITEFELIKPGEVAINSISSDVDNENKPLYKLDTSSGFVGENVRPYNTEIKPKYHLSKFHDCIGAQCCGSGKLLNGFYAMSGYQLFFVNGYLSDEIVNGKVMTYAINSPDNKHKEHWNMGYPHCEYEPAIWDDIENYKEWWINGEFVER